eukprot:CAMPEP_0178417956 /NCGR_PEP_ID=MMETSP0689_2-20121128/24839_1 /TAXON_ID=160604 /ORGANISM="Amphidinium massartii, Strain CS-259" /LENGTH=143 /DNA_ID=CAMNT_0020039333 /DNA_START=86 /DNA_END=517 /DNA_ORIENTATION=-
MNYPGEPVDKQKRRQRQCAHRQSSHCGVDVSPVRLRCIKRVVEHGHRKHSRQEEGQQQAPTHQSPHTSLYAMLRQEEDSEVKKWGGDLSEEKVGNIKGASTSEEADGPNSQRNNMMYNHQRHAHLWVNEHHTAVVDKITQGER